MRGPVVDQREALGAELDARAVHLDALDPPGHPSRVLHGDLVARRMVAEAYGEAAPDAGDARLDVEGGAAQPEAEHPLDAGPVHPARRARVPSPAATSDVRRLGIDGGRDDVGFDSIAVEAGARARVVHGVEDREELPHSISLAESREGHDGPDGA